MRLFTNGFETNTLLGSPGFIEFSQNYGQNSIDTSTVRSGTYSMRVNGMTTANIAGVRYYFAYTNQTGGHFHRFYFRVATRPTGNNNIFSIQNSSSVAIVKVILNSSGRLELWDEDGQVGSDSSVLSLGTWYRVEVHTDASGSAGAHIVESRVDGRAFASSHTRSLSTGTARAFWGGNGDLESQTTGDWYFDDLAINNTDINSFFKSTEQSWCGAGHVINMRPGGETAWKAWTRGGTDSGSNYGQVDELTPNDDTDYVYSSTLDQYDIYSLTSSGIPANSKIKLLALNYRAHGDSDISAENCYFKIYIYGTDNWNWWREVIDVDSGWETNNNGIPRNPQLVVYRDPYESGELLPWTVDSLDNAKVGISISTVNTYPIYITTMWLVVEYADEILPRVNSEVIGSSDAMIY